MKNQLKDRHKTFCLAYLETYNASEAARQAGYKRKAEIAGYELLQKPYIKRYIREKLNVVWEDKLELVQARVFQLWVDIAFGENPQEGETIQDKIAKKAMQLKASELLAKYFPATRMDESASDDGEFKIIKLKAVKPDDGNRVLTAPQAN